MFLRACTQSRSQFFGALRHIRQSFEQRAQIQPCPDGENRQPAAMAQVPQHSQRHLAVYASRCCLTGCQSVDEMMWDAAALRYSRLGSADVEPTVKLRRITC